MVLQNEIPGMAIHEITPTLDFGRIYRSNQLKNHNLSYSFDNYIDLFFLSYKSIIEIVDEDFSKIKYEETNKIFKIFYGFEFNELMCKKFLNSIN